MAKEALIKVKDLTVSFGKSVVLKNIDFEINKGEVFGIVGLSGSGKTTLLNTLIGFLEPVSGEILYKIEPEKKKGKKKEPEFNPIMKNLLKVRQVFGFAAQEPSFYPQLTVVENLQYFSSMYSLPKDMRNKNINTVLELVGLGYSKNLRSDRLSGGMQKRLDIACSLVHNPKVLILDEPTADLDPILRGQMWDLIKRINSKGTTVVVASHFLQEIETFCTRIGILHNHKIERIGTPDHIRNLYSRNEEIHLETQPGDYVDIVNRLRKVRGLHISKIVNKGHKLVIYTMDSMEVLHNLLHIVEKKNEQLIDVDVNKPTLKEVFESFVKEGKNG